MKIEMNEENKIGYYAIIPSTVLFNERIKANEKLLYAVITVLSNKEGYCYASNTYLGKLLKAQPHTISKWVSHLKSSGFLCLDIIKNDKGEIIQRRIYICQVGSALSVEMKNLKKTNYRLLVVIFQKFLMFKIKNLSQ